MKKNILFGTIILATASTLFTACKKENDPPIPVEEELITTLKLNVTASGFSKSFIYKIENGFGNSSQGSITIDTIILSANTTYDVEIEVLNEKENPAEDITEEILEENEDHLFLFTSTPASGSGSLSTSEGSKDNKGEPLNQKIKFTTGGTGNGSLDVFLMHKPTNKNGNTPAASGGSTDVEATFPVRLQ